MNNKKEVEFEYYEKELIKIKCPNYEIARENLIKEIDKFLKKYLTKSSTIKIKIGKNDMKFIDKREIPEAHNELKRLGYFIVENFQEDVKEYEGKIMVDIVIILLKKYKDIEEKTKTYLDESIRFWREKIKKEKLIAECYIDAFQSVRSSLLGKTLSREKK